MEKSLKDMNNVESSTQNENPVAQPKSETPLNSGLPDVQYGGLADDRQPLVPPVSKKKGVFTFLKTLTIEPVMFTFIFGYIVEMSCMTNMMMDKGCRYYYNYSDELCSNLSADNNSREKTQAEVLATNYMLYANLMSLIAAVAVIFIAPWSDKYGRKLPLALACIGVIIGDICILICVINYESSLFYIVLAKIPAQMFGGFICVMTVVFSHASEVSSQSTRTLKYATVEISMGSGLALGGLTGGTVLRYYGYFYVYLLSTTIHFISLFWSVFFVQETRGLDVKASWGHKIKDFFQCDNLSAGCKASARPRENHGRTLLFFFFLSMCVIVLTYESFGSIGFTYVHHIYNWDPMTYNSVNTIFVISGMVTMIIAIPLLLRVYKFTDNALGIIGSISMIGKFFLLGFAHYGVFVFYIGNIIGSIGTISTFIVRSGISKIVDKDEVGKVFSFLATCESILPMFGTIFIAKVFGATIDITPSITYLMTSFLLFVPLGTFTMAFIARKRQEAEAKVAVQ